jgi:hypothetical protein
MPVQAGIQQIFNIPRSGQNPTALLINALDTGLHRYDGSMKYQG